MQWLPGMDSNHEETTPRGISNLLISGSSASPESCQNDPVRTAFVQKRQRIKGLRIKGLEVFDKVD